jgi:predicted nuclease of restriction endonuclease-like (RecB) superfamily
MHTMTDINTQEYGSFIKEVKQRIYNSQYEALKTLNKALITLYWEIGKEIYIQQNEKGWGKSVVEVLSKELQKEFPNIKGFSARNLWNMRNFFVTYNENEILQPLAAEISWTKNTIIMDKCKDDLEREFYIKMTKRFGWTKNVLINNLENKAYEKYLLNQTNFDETVP